MKNLLLTLTMLLSMSALANLGNQELIDVAAWLGASAERTITFSNDIKRIIKKKCKMCHNSSKLGKFIKYSQAYAKREQILKRVYVKRDMPKVGKLSDEQRQLFADWVAGGALE